MSILKLLHSFPYIEEKHNVMDAVGQTALLLTYSVSLILRNKDETDWANEWFPKAGYGWFLAFLFTVVLPAPIFIYLYINKKLEKTAVDDFLDGLGDNIATNLEDLTSESFDNPILEAEEGVYDRDIPSERISTRKKPKRESLKSSRSGPTRTAIRVPLAKAHREIEELRSENQQLLMEKQELTAALEGARTSVEDTTPVLNVADRSVTSVHGGKPVAIGLQQGDLERVTELKALADDGMLGKETLNAAKQHLEMHVVADLQVRKKWLKSCEYGTYEHLRQEARMNADAGDASIADARESLRTWLTPLRLIHHELKFVEVGGRAMCAEDLKMCGHEDIDALCADMTSFEKTRFMEAIKQLQSSDQPAEENRPDQALSDGNQDTIESEDIAQNTGDSLHVRGAVSDRANSPAYALGQMATASNGRHESD
eukprot:COSAG02_NODE_367_length_23739_cov_16.775127_10_plen_428_part_00